MKTPVSVRTQFDRLTRSFLLLTVTIFLAMLAVLLAYHQHYTDLLYNVTTASEFNQDFKETIDLKMYYYVIESSYSEGLPTREVEEAQAIARDLAEHTDQKESLRAITSVQDLCANLEKKMEQIAETDSYDQREVQLENNIYVLTSLIQEYMYNYLYHEAVQLNRFQQQMMVQIIGIVAALAVLAVGIIGLMLRRTRQLTRSITQPIEALSRRMEEISGGDLEPRAPVEAQTEEFNTLGAGAEEMVRRIRTLLEESTRKQESLRRAELALLQAQINPHFLYNTMDTIIWLIEAGKNQEAEDMVADLSNFFRCSLSKGQDIVPLETEEKHIRCYLQIQQVRYKDILDYTVEIPAELLGVRLPKLTLQPLVENALYHGIKLKRAHGWIRVTAAREGEDILLQVADNGAGMSPQRLEEIRRGLERGERVGFGLATVHERLQLCFGPAYGLTVESGQGTGTSITVRIPAQWKEGERS